MAARSEAEVTSLLVYKSPAWKGGALYLFYLRGTGCPQTPQNPFLTDPRPPAKRAELP
jgi:hypothetical protein